MLPDTNNVAVVLVTYGERASFVERVVEAVSAQALKNIVIVDNGSPLENSHKLTALTQNHKTHIELIRCDSNGGSAGGFSDGIAAGFRLPDIDFVWLLDDDNKPQPDAFAKLVDAYRYLGADEANVLVSLRQSRHEYLSAAYTGRRIGIKRGTFLGFGLFEKISKRFSPGLKSDQKDTAVRYPILAIDHGPYGGLFFSREMQRRIGLPNRKFYLYSDDHEYTMRVKRHGGRIYLCAESVVDDLEVSWGENENRMPLLIRDDVEAWKIASFVRNRVYLERISSVVNLTYWLNAAAYMLILLILSIRAGHGIGFIKARFSLILSSARAGYSGRFLKEE